MTTQSISDQHKKVLRATELLAAYRTDRTIPIKDNATYQAALGGYVPQAGESWTDYGERIGTIVLGLVVLSDVLIDELERSTGTPGDALVEGYRRRAEELAKE